LREKLFEKEKVCNWPIKGKRFDHLKILDVRISWRLLFFLLYDTFYSLVTHEPSYKGTNAYEDENPSKYFNDRNSKKLDK
jgi:hypothetical protein